MAHTLTQTEKNALIQFHQDELNKALKAVTYIKSRISELTGKPKRAHITKAPPALATKPTVKTTHHKKASAEKKGRRAPVKWAQFIPNTIKQHGKPMTAREILSKGAKKFNIPTGRKEYKSLTQTLRNMRIAKRLTSETKKGDRQKYYKVVA